jgi:uncharacterized surface protein with fasciclin (FAS1) repeats
MIKIIKLIFFAGLFIFFFSCKKDLQQDPKYKRPDWLAGKLYTQIVAQSELSTFAHCLKLVGYDTIINTSGSYTVFAPNNDAFVLYFQNHQGYHSVEDIPIRELTRIVKYHIIQNPWSEEQLQKLDIYGWIDTLDQNNDQPKGFKRETLLREKDQKFGISHDQNNNISIVDTLQSSFYRRNATDSRKFAPVFYKKYLDAYGLNGDDYKFYFNRSFENANDLYYLEGRIVKGDIFAENGFVHIIDRVIEPLQNAYQILSTVKNNHSYSEFLGLIDAFPHFTFNATKTNAQSGAHAGLAVDSLFDISYPDLVFDIVNEQTKAPTGTVFSSNVANVTIRYQNGLIAPTNEAFEAFINEYLVGSGKWGSLNNAPRFIKKIIVNTYMSSNPIYPTYIQKGFNNGENDIVKLDGSTVVQQQFGSNCSFIGVNKAIVPRAFNSVTGPIYLNRGYSTAMYAIEQAGLLTALKKENNNYSLFVESDVNCSDDSSLIYRSSIGTQPSSFAAFQISGNRATEFQIGTNDLRTLLLNHIGLDNPKRIARKEFIKNMAGNYLIVNNQTGEVSGTAHTIIGYMGSVETQVIPSQISTNTDNGKTYDIKNWFSFSGPSIYSKISSTPAYSKFQALLLQAGLIDVANFRYNFISDNEFYTIFVPNNTAIDSYRTDTLTTDQLRKFLMMHFVQGEIIFTDGYKPAGYYETTRVDESSTAYSTAYTKIYLNPGIDVINIPDKNGNTYLAINESQVTNMITSITLSTTPAAYLSVVSNAVIHEIDKVLLFGKVDTQ